MTTNISKGVLEKDAYASFNAKDPESAAAIRQTVDTTTVRKLAPFTNTTPSETDLSWTDDIISWVNGTGSASVGGYTVQWVDVDNGSDSYNGTRRDRAKKTFPQYPAAGVLYMVKSQNPIALTNRIDFSAAGAAIASWDHHINGKLRIIGDANTGDVTRTIRFAAADCALINVLVTPPVGNGAGNRACINLTSAAVNCRIVGCTFEYPSSGGLGFAIDVNSPFFTIEDNEIIGGHAGISIATSTAQLGSETRKSYVRRNKINLSPLVPEHSYHSDGITVGGSCDWRHQLILSHNQISNYWENAIDTTMGSRVVTIFNYIGAPSLTFHGQPVYPSGIILGNTGNTGQRNICIGNKIIGAGDQVLQTSAINTRGGVKPLIMGNIISGWDKGVVQGNPGASDMVLVHNTIINTRTGVRIENGNTGARIFNNIIHSNDVCFDTGGGGSDILTGGNLCVGSMNTYEVNTSKLSADLQFSKLENLIDIVTFAPTEESRKSALVSLNFVARDMFGSRYNTQCAGAVS